VIGDGPNTPVNEGHEKASDQTAPAGRPAGAIGRDWALARGFSRGDDDPRPISEIPEADLLAGFGDRR
jgi:hypothetical protein